MVTLQLLKNHHTHLDWTPTIPNFWERNIINKHQYEDELSQLRKLHNENQLYFMEAILYTKINANKQIYLIKWINIPGYKNYTSWEPNEKSQNAISNYVIITQIK